MPMISRNGRKDKQKWKEDTCSINRFTNNNRHTRKHLSMRNKDSLGIHGTYKKN